MKIIKSVSAKKQVSASEITFAGLYDEIDFQVNDLKAKQVLIKKLDNIDKKLSKLGFLPAKIQKDSSLWFLKGIPTPSLMTSIGKVLGMIDKNASKIPTLVDITEKNNLNSQDIELDYFSVEISVGMNDKNKLFIQIDF